jgi:hypothetical protein
VEGYRFPSLSLDLARTPDIAAAWAGTLVGDRIDVQNVAARLVQLADRDLQFLLIGHTESIDQFQWLVTCNISPYDPYNRTALLAQTAGDTSAQVARAVTEGSTLAASATIGASSLSVATPTGPLWTTAADDFPLTISVQGIDVDVTAISGASSPQTFTVTPAHVTRNLSGGQVVELARAPVYGR